MPRVIILKGLPGSGKSTWAKQQVQEVGWKRVNKDELRAMIDNGKWSRSNEKMVLKVRDQIILEAVKNKQNIIVDDTNFAPEHERHIRELVKSLASVEVKFFDTPLEECIRRDLQRPNSVGERVIRSFYNDYLKKEPEEYPHDNNLEDAIICDIDGTLAKMVDRGAFEWHKVGEDKPNKPVINLIRSYYHGKLARVILVSGRDSVCRPETEKWLQDNSIAYHELFMRAENNNEKDAIIKRRIFDEKIRGKYNVLFILDDRNQVVEMWREMGLSCFQVAEGNF